MLADGSVLDDVLHTNSSREVLHKSWKYRDVAFSEIESIYELALISIKLTYTGGSEVQKRDRIWRLVQNGSEGLNEEEKRMLQQVCTASEQTKDFGPALDLAQLLWLLISNRGRKLMAMAGVEGPQQNLFFQIITKACDGLGLQDTHTSSQLPFPYVFMIFAMVQINNVVQVLVAGSRLGMDIILADIGSIITEALYIVFIPAFYNTLLQICVGLEDPMGKDDFDIPLDKGILQPTSDLCKKMVELAELSAPPPPPSPEPTPPPTPPPPPPHLLPQASRQEPDSVFTFFKEGSDTPEPPLTPSTSSSTQPQPAHNRPPKAQNSGGETRERL